MISGNPFVDTGLAVIASLAKKDSIEDLSYDNLVEVHKKGEFLSKYNSKVKSMSMIFTINNILTNPSIKDSEKRLSYYSKITSAMLDKISSNDVQERCECCGNDTSLDIDKLIRDTLVPLGFPDKKRYIGRDWFPLAGSLTSDAQALPSASRALNLCAKCLFAVHYLPLGVILVNGKLTLFQSTSIEFWYDLIKSQVAEAFNRISLGNFETIGSKEGSAIAVKRLMDVMGEMKEENIERTSLFLWQFSNTGQNPDCRIEEIPNPALTFLYKAVTYGLNNELMDLVKRDRKNSRFSLLTSISHGNDYSNLYPYKKYDGVSQTLFVLYQIYIRKFSPTFLNLTYQIAVYLKSQLKEKEFENLGKDLQKRNDKQHTIRKYIVEMISKKIFSDDEISEEQILQLYNFEDKIKLSYNFWNFIKYYMYHALEKFYIPEIPIYDHNKPILSLNKEYKDIILWLGNKIYSEYISEKGKDRFINDVMKRYSSGKINSSWLRNQFLKLGEKYENFHFEIWKYLCIRNGKESTYELLYLFRLLWSNWLNKSNPVNFPYTKYEPNKTEIDDRMDLTLTQEKLIYSFVDDYLFHKGSIKFQNYVLKGLRSKNLGLGFIRNKLSHFNRDFYSDDAWDMFLQDKDGVVIRTMRLFQINLLMANRFREQTF